MSDSGFLITGKEGAPTGLVRYTLKDGHVKLVNEKDRSRQKGKWMRQRLSLRKMA